MCTEAQLQLIPNYEEITLLLMYTESLLQLIQIYEIKRNSRFLVYTGTKLQLNPNQSNHKNNWTDVCKMMHFIQKS